MMIIKNVKEKIQEWVGKTYNKWQLIFLVIFILGSVLFNFIKDYFPPVDIFGLILSSDFFLIIFVVLSAITLVTIIVTGFRLIKIVHEHTFLIVIASIILVIFDIEELQKGLRVIIIAFAFIFYSGFIIKKKEKYDDERRKKDDEEITKKIRHSYESLLNKIPYQNKIKQALKFDNWQSACLSIYILQRIRDIKLFTRAPDDLPEKKFNPCDKDEPNLFKYITVEKNEDKNYLELIILKSMDNTPLQKLRNGGELKSEERFELAKIFTKIECSSEKDDPELAAYCNQLTKLSHGEKSYDLDSLHIWDNKSAGFQNDNNLVKKLVSIKDQNVLGDIIEYEFDKETYNHIINIHDFSNLALLEKSLNVTSSMPYVVNPDNFTFAPQLKDPNVKLKNIWMTDKIIKTSELKYMMTLGGAYLLDTDWFPFEFYKGNSEGPKFYIQHPFQEKVVMEVFRHQNYAYPSEMIQNWKKWMIYAENKDKNFENRFVWIREGAQPVVNKITITQNLIDVLEKEYEKNKINLPQSFKEELKKSIGDDNFLLVFQIYDQFVRTPTTGKGIITIEKDNQSSSKLYYLTEKFKKRQDDLKEIFELLRQQKMLDKKDFQYIWKEKNDKVHSFLNPESWINLGVLGIIVKEVKCYYALLKIIDYYSNSEYYKNKLTSEERNKLIMSKEEIYDYLEEEYLEWLNNVLKTITTNETKSKISRIVNNPKIVDDTFSETLKYLGKLKELHEKNGDIRVLDYEIYKKLKIYENKPRC